MRISGRIRAAKTFNTASFSRPDLFICCSAFLLHNSRHLKYLCQLKIYNRYATADRAGASSGKNHQKQLVTGPAELPTQGCARDRS
jgi:hypothetical protein